jgi:xylulokinase
LLRWFRDHLGEEEIDMARRENRDVYSVLIEKGGSAISPLFVLPHLTSSGTPYMDIQSAGAILGLSFNTTKGNIIRGILEGVALEMKLNLSILEKAQIPVKEIRAIGGGAKSREWLQMRADIYNTRVVSLNVSEAACLGAAILAGWGAGLFSSVDEAIKSTVREKEVFYPRPEKNELYQKKFEIYQQIYPAIKNLNHQIKQFQQEI